MFAFREVAGRVEVAFTDRHGPSGTTLNLALPGTVPAAAPGASPQEGLAAVAAVFGPGNTVVGMRQVHGPAVAVIDAGYEGTPLEADALVTARSDVSLLVRVADCVPVLLADVDRGLVGAVHAGRLGLVAGVVPNAVGALRSLGAAEVHAWLGPHVCGACYEVPAPMREDIAAAIPETFAETSWGTPALDLAGGVRAQLAAAGVEQGHVQVVGGCTLEDDALWSHRRDGDRAGRLGALVRVLP
ncbi:polyphenol oxidase family protein [Nocardioides sp.]|uniref:polyphenol oxidase family protein n=1 Tax=Nocardioides sp. TaxID=35761 RepID=UPI002733A9FE|nr:polyphenol oxidase family protein [Nocardioides sp.]MDP3892625.1 polyphenol oxidase family protein [Nocardioides sp.]